MDDIAAGLDRARALAAAGEDDAAKQGYLDVLRLAPENVAALIELGALAEAGGHLSAARTAFQRSVDIEPDNAVARTGLGNVLRALDDLPAAQPHYRAALAADPGFAPAHQGLAHTLFALGDPAAESHWRAGFAGRAVIRQRFRGKGSGIPLLLLIAARGGDIPTRQWIDNRIFAVTAICADFYDPALPLPEHAVVVNAIGDADLCAGSLVRAESLLARTTAPVINHPSLVRPTGRESNARRLAAVPGIVAPRITTLSRAEVASGGDLGFPILLRTPGFHTGQHFQLVDAQEGLAAAVASLPGDPLMVIQYLDARGKDGMARKYRVMFIDGAIYPLHLAISADWKVHYFTAAMAGDPAFREEEHRFLNDMPATLGNAAMAALAGIRDALGLDYCGVDFGIQDDGSLLLFEANATMVIAPIADGGMWDYRRPAINAAIAAASNMVTRRATPR